MLRAWSCHYRDEDPWADSPAPVVDRLDMDDLFRRVEKGRVKPDFALLMKSRAPMPKLSPEKNVVSISWTADEVQEMILRVHAQRKSRHLSLDLAGRSLTGLDVGIGAVMQGFKEPVPVHMYLEYRVDFEVPNHFGNAKGQVAFDSGVGYEDGSEMIRKRAIAAHRVDFWAWQRMQATKPKAEGLTLLNLVDDLNIQEIFFHDDDIPCVGMPLCVWEEQMPNPGYIAVLPEPSGGCHVEGLVPRYVADHCAKVLNTGGVKDSLKCQTFPIR